MVNYPELSHDDSQNSKDRLIHIIESDGLKVQLARAPEKAQGWNIAISRVTKYSFVMNSFDCKS